MVAYEKAIINDNLLSIKNTIYKNIHKPPIGIIEKIKSMNFNKNYHFYIKYNNQIYYLNGKTSDVAFEQSIFIKSLNMEIIGSVNKKYIKNIILQHTNRLKHIFYEFILKSVLIGLIVFLISLFVFYLVLAQFDKKIKQLKTISEEFKNITSLDIKRPCFSDEVGCIINNFIDYTNQTIKLERLKNAITAHENMDDVYETLRMLLKKEYSLFDVNIFITENNQIKKSFASNIYCENCKLAKHNIKACKCYKALLEHSNNIVSSDCSKDYYIVCLPLFEKFYKNQSTTIVQLINKTPIENLEAIKKSLSEIKEIIGYKLLLSIFKDQSYKDPLTGIYNRLFLNEYLDLLSNQIKTQNIQFATLFIDIDDFKSLNDTYGHKMGDKFLSEIANIISSNLRSSDIVARYGGEEFVVILKDIPKQIAINLANRIRKSIEEFHIDGIKRSVSIGVAFWPDHCQNLHDCIKNADLAMYRAKQSGKNIVFEFES